MRWGRDMFVINLLKNLKRDTKGATAVEYGIIIAMIVLAMMAALQGVGNANTETWEEVEQASVDAMNG